MKNILKKNKGYTLIELVITLLVLGLVCYFIINMCVELLLGSTEQTQLVEEVNLALAKMEESFRTGVFVSAQGWASSGAYEWRRLVTTLKSDNGNPTLVEIKIEIRKGSNIIYSLINHIAG